MAVGIAKIYALATEIPRSLFFESDSMLSKPCFPSLNSEAGIAKAMCSSPSPSCGEGMRREPRFLKSNDLTFADFHCTTALSEVAYDTKTENFRIEPR